MPYHLPLATNPPGGPVARRPRPRAVAVLATLPLALGLLATTPAASSAARHPAPAPSVGADVVTDWNRIAMRTYGQPSTPLAVPVQALFQGFVGAAVHDAVATIEGGHAVYVPQPAAARGASVEAAAATAAYRTLAALVPSSLASLEADYRRWLDRVPDGASQDAGVTVGEEAAHAVLGARAADGRDADVRLTTTPGPGTWDTVGPAGMAVPWVGFVIPMVLPSATSIRLHGPDALTSAAYAADLDEVRRMGERTRSERSAAQTDLAMFYTDNAVRQYNDALSDRLRRHGASAGTAARDLALLNLATADSIITCWRTKYEVHNWRPQQAIQRADADGNPLTVQDPTWEPLVPNPPYPDYASGHACLSGAASQILSRLYGSRHLDIDVRNPAMGATRHYGSAAALNRDTKNARIWLGLHFRRAMDDGNRIGRVSADYVVDHALRPTTKCGRSGPSR